MSMKKVNIIAQIFLTKILLMKIMNFTEKKDKKKKKNY